MDDFLAPVRDYVDYVLSPDRLGESEDTKLVRLARLLDRLAVHAEFTNDGPADVDIDDGPDDTQMLYQTMNGHFPELGHYSTVLDIDPLKAQNNIAVGDAIDDLADIAADLLAVVRVAELSDAAAAKQEFNFRFRTHWGFHLRELQQYIFCRLRGF